MCCLALLSDPTTIATSHPTLHALLMLSASAATSFGTATSSVARAATSAAIARLNREGGDPTIANAPSGAQDAGSAAVDDATAGGVAQPRALGTVAQLVGAQLSALPSASSVSRSATEAVGLARDVGAEWGRSLGSFVPREARQTPN